MHVTLKGLRIVLVGPLPPLTAGQRLAAGAFNAEADVGSYADARRQVMPATEHRSHKGT